MADFEMTESEQAKKKCINALKNPIPNRDELIEALRLATEHGFPEVVKKILAGGHSDLLEEITSDFKGEITSDGTGEVTSDCGTKTKGIERELSRVIENKIWLQKMTDYFSRPWSEVEKENGDNGPEMALNKFSALMEVVDKLEPSKALQTMKCGRRMIQHLIGDLSSETQEQSEARTARIRFLQIILDKTYIGENQVDATILEDECSTREHTDSIDTKQAIYQAIAESHIEELKRHPCFAAVVNKKWESSYYKYLHILFFVIFILFLIFLTTALVLAARSSEPRDYHGVAGGAQGLCEALTFLYILLTAALSIIRHVYHLRKMILASHNSKRSCTHRLKYIGRRAGKLMTMDDVLKICGRFFILLIIPFRATGSQWQWLFASLTIICNGHRIFYYISVFSHTGHYVATLSILVKRDLPRIIIVFLVLNFSLGGGLYFAFVGENNSNPDGTNTTREIYTFWESGFHIVTGGEASEPGGWFPVIVYLVFVFTISIIFFSIVVAQFTKTYSECSAQAKVNVILSKNEIMLKMEDMISCCRCCAAQGDKRDMTYKYLKTPYSSGEVDFRPASVRMIQEMRQEIINEMERKFESLRKSMRKTDVTSVFSATDH